MRNLRECIMVIALAIWMICAEVQAWDIEKRMKSIEAKITIHQEAYPNEE